MRSIIHEMTYEKPLVSGHWRYQRAGLPTGALELWKLTAAVDGYRFLRVDLDARAAPSGQSTLYHLTLDDQAQPVQLKYRFWGSSLEIIGTLLLEEDAVILTRETVAGRQEDVLPLPNGYLFWFPATAGLSLLAGKSGVTNATAVTLSTKTDDPQEIMSLTETRVTVTEKESVKLAVLDSELEARLLSIRWDKQERRIWTDDQGWPLKMERDDGLTAVLAQRVRYGTITKPGATGVQQSAGARTTKL